MQHQLLALLYTYIYISTRGYVTILGKRSQYLRYSYLEPDQMMTRLPKPAN